MIKVENIEIWGWKAAIRGMRNPMNSWDKNDSYVEGQAIDIGNNDLDLMKKLYKGGTEQRKFLRMVHIQMDITAPLYWYKEYDTYKVGTVADSCSTMHKITAKEFELDDFSHEMLLCSGFEILLETIKHLNECRNAYIDYDNWDNGGFAKPTKKEIWYNMIQLLPSSYNQRRTVDISYEVAINMIRQRTGHKLNEWREFVEILKNLPYMKDITNDTSK